MIEIEIKKVKLSQVRLNPDNPRRISEINFSGIKYMEIKRHQ